MAKQITSEVNASEQELICIDTETGLVLRPSMLRFVEVAEGDLEHLIGRSTEELIEYGRLFGEPVVGVQDAAEWVRGVNSDAGDAFLQFYAAEA